MMKKLIYSTLIDSTKEDIWKTIIEKDTYAKWVKAFSPNSEFEGEWKEGAEIKFFDGDMGGTVAMLDSFQPFERIVATHIATITKDKLVETTGPMTEKWIGTKEIYELEKKDHQTELRILMEVHEDFEEMFNNCWPKALENIKNLSENK